MEQLLLELLIRLETVGERDESLFDTVVREKIGDLSVTPSEGTTFIARWAPACTS
jgi:hypothetical protein